MKLTSCKFPRLRSQGLTLTFQEALIELLIIRIIQRTPNFTTLLRTKLDNSLQFSKKYKPVAGLCPEMTDVDMIQCAGCS